MSSVCPLDWRHRQQLYGEAIVGLHDVIPRQANVPLLMTDYIIVTRALHILPRPTLNSTNLPAWIGWLAKTPLSLL